MEFIHWTNKLICQNGIRYMSEECQNTIRCLLIVQIVLIWYWSQFTTGVISLDSFYEESIFWSLYIVESEHKDSLNRGFLLTRLVWIIKTIMIDYIVFIFDNIYLINYIGSTNCIRIFDSFIYLPSIWLLPLFQFSILLTSSSTHAL